MLKGIAAERLVNRAGIFSPVDNTYISRLVKSGCQVIRYTWSLDGEMSWSPDMLAYQ